MSEWIVYAETVDDFVDGMFSMGEKIVRCEDCEHWIQFGDECFANCDFGHGVTDKQFYCRDGERRTE